MLGDRDDIAAVAEDTIGLLPPAAWKMSTAFWGVEKAKIVVDCLQTKNWPSHCLPVRLVPCRYSRGIWPLPRAWITLCAPMRRCLLNVAVPKRLPGGTERLPEPSLRAEPLQNFRCLRLSGRSRLSPCPETHTWRSSHQYRSREYSSIRDFPCH